MIWLALLLACGDDPPAPGCTIDADCATGRCLGGMCRASTADGSPYCLDRDHDGYGIGCALGDDCDDADHRQRREEICDAFDNDCDGIADEDVALSACGICDPSCDVIRFGTDDGVVRPPFVLDDSSQDVVVDADGSLLLAAAAPAPLHLAWVASHDGTVAKIDTAALVLLARYYSSPEGERGSPRAVAVGASGDAYVANLDGTVVRIAASTDRCVDRDGNGEIETSGTTPIAFADEECRLFTGRAVGQPESIALRIDRGIDGELVERVFVGGTFEPDVHLGTILELDGNDGTEIARMTLDSLPESATPGLNPHDLIVDARGQLWAVPAYGTVFGAPGATLARVDTDLCPGDPRCLEPCDGASGDGCAVQRIFLPGLGTNCSTLDARQRLWLSDFDDGLLYSYDPSLPYGGRIDILTPSGTGIPMHGIAADADRLLWVSRVERGFAAYDLASMSTAAIEIAGSEDLAITGVFVDGYGRGWGLSMWGNATVASIADGMTSVITNVVPELGPLAAWCSDPSGAEARTERGPQGSHVVRIDACPGGRPSSPVRWRWLEQAHESTSRSYVGLRLRTGEASTIERTPWIGVALEDRVDLEALFDRLRIEPGQILEVELELRTVATDRPRVRFLDVARSAECVPFG